MRIYGYMTYNNFCNFCGTKLINNDCNNCFNNSNTLKNFEQEDD